MHTVRDVTMESVADNTTQFNNRNEVFFTPIAGSAMFSGYRERQSSSEDTVREGSSSSEETGHFRAVKEQSEDKRNARQIISGL